MADFYSNLLALRLRENLGWTEQKLYSKTAVLVRSEKFLTVAPVQADGMGLNVQIAHLLQF